MLFWSQHKQKLCYYVQVYPLSPPPPFWHQREQTVDMHIYFGFDRQIKLVWLWDITKWTGYKTLCGKLVKIWLSENFATTWLCELFFFLRWTRNMILIKYLVKIWVCNLFFSFDGLQSEPWVNIYVELDYATYFFLRLTAIRTLSEHLG